MINTADTRILKVINKIDELSVMVDFLDELGQLWNLPPPLVMSLNLVLEEALTNIIFYGYDDKEEHTIEIRFEKLKDQISVSIMDDGHEYDPTIKPDPDLTLPLEERQIGGLGILFIKKIMDSVRYERKENKNYLILTKQLSNDDHH